MDTIVAFMQRLESLVDSGFVKRRYSKTLLSDETWKNAVSEKEGGQLSLRCSPAWPGSKRGVRKGRKMRAVSRCPLELFVAVLKSCLFAADSGNMNIWRYGAKAYKEKCQVTMKHDFDASFVSCRRCSICGIIMRFFIFGMFVLHRGPLVKTTQRMRVYEN